MGVTLGGIGAAVGGGSALASLLGLGQNQPTPPAPAYTPQYLSGADSGAYANIGALGSTIGSASGAANTIANNPYAPGYQTSANAIAPYATAAGGNILGASQSLLPYAQQTLQTGFDPQQALYNQQFQQNTDQTRAAEAARGIAMTPYGAGVENMSDINFNNQWQNQQLGRQQTAASTAEGLTGAAGTGTTSGLNTLQQGAQLPYATANTIGNNALSAYGTVAGLQQPQIADYLQYLGLGNSSSAANNAIYSSQLTAQQNQFNQQQTLGKNLGTSISGLGTYFGNSGGSTVAPTSSSGTPVSYGSYGGISYPQYT
jgi:hypothetical protein